MNEIQNSIFEAIQLFADSSVKKSNATITIKGEITDIINLAEGIYKAKYLTDAFTVYSNTSSTYAVGDVVYILVPDGDFSKEKLIVGGGAELIKDNVITEVNNYLNSSDNMLQGLVSDISLCSYTATTGEYRIPANSELHKMLNIYLTMYKTISLSAKVKTALEDEQQKAYGQYGIALKLPLITIDSALEELEFEEVIELNNYNILGNPYALLIPTEQTVIKEINNTQFKINENKDIVLTYYTAEPFYQLENKVDDIFFSDIGLYFTEAKPESDNKGHIFVIEASEGTVFRPQGSNSKTLTPKVWLNGTEVPQDNLQQVYWFIEDTSITTDLYRAGAGWRLLNPVNGEAEPVSSTQWSIKKPLAAAAVYKCVLVYNKTILTSTIKITNASPEVSLTIRTSTGSTQYIQGAGTVDVYVEVEGLTSAAAYNWGRYTQHGALVETYVDKDNSTSQSVYSFNKLEIDALNTIKCSVTEFDSNTPLGTVELSITVGEANNYKLVVNNSNKIYKYDANGNSPASLSFQGPAAARLETIVPLSYQLFKNDGTELNETEYSICKYTWKVPKNSLIQINPSLVTSEDDIYYYVAGMGNMNQIPYTISNRYNNRKTDNAIILEVDFKGNIVSETVNLFFLKDGENGTNGTSYSAIVVYDNYGYEQKDKYGQYHRLKLFYYPSTSSWYYSYYDQGQVKLEKFTSLAPTLDTKVFRDGEPISNYTVSYKWFNEDFLTSKKCLLMSSLGLIQGNLAYSESNLYIAEALVEITESGTENSFGENKVINAFYPIEITILNNDINTYEIVSIENGFSEVMYNADGVSPQYDASEPFYLTYVGEDIEWQYSDTLKSKVSDLTINQQSLYPIETFSSINSVYSYVKAIYNNNIVVRPIVFYMDAYSHSNLNTWDGTKIEVGENEEYLLAPQIGAGFKDDNNKFTGMVMGTRYNGSTSQTDIGLFGYGHGISTYWLDAKTGKAIFGAPGSQIVIDPSGNTAALYGGGYEQDPTTGMLIDLAEPGIHWGNGNFDVNSDGSFQFGNNKIVFDTSQDKIILKDVVITWDTDNIPTESDMPWVGEDIEELNEFIAEKYDSVLDNLQEQVDGKAETWYQATDPASNWTTEALKKAHIGDLWFNTTNQKTFIYSESYAWEEANGVPDEVFDAIDGKAQIFASQPKPPYYKNDLWVQGSNGDIYVCQTERLTGSYTASDWVKASKYTDDSALSSFISGDYADTLNNIETQIDGKARSWYQATDPSLTWDTSEDHEGDLWYNTSSSSQVTSIYQNGVWKAMSVPKSLFDTIDGIASIYVTIPTSPVSGDLLIPTSDITVNGITYKAGKVYRYNGSAWIEISYTDDSALNNFISGDYADALDSIETQIDGKARSWYQATDPSLTWDTSEDHEGDLWYNTSADSQVTSIYKNGAWQATSVPKALFDTIDGIASIYVTMPSKPVSGDLLIPTSNITVNGTTYKAGKVYRYNGSAWVEISYTDDSALNSFKTNVQKALGNETTEIGSDYIISPKIGGGYLYIGNSSGTSVEINPLNQRTGGSAVLIDAKYNGTSIFTLGTNGSAYFKGKLDAAYGTFKGISGGTSYSWSITEAGVATFASMKITGGQIDINSKFSVSSTGVLTATGADISGTLTATGGKIGGWSIYGNVLGSAFGSTGNYYGMGFDARESMFTGAINGGTGGRVIAIGRLGDSSTAEPENALIDDTWGNAAFQVYANGKLVANNIEANGGKIAGMTIQSYTIPPYTLNNYQSAARETWCLGADFTSIDDGFTIDEVQINVITYTVKVYILYTAYGRFVLKRYWNAYTGNVNASLDELTYLDKDQIPTA